MVHAGSPPLQTLSLNRGISQPHRDLPNDRQGKPIRPGGKALRGGTGPQGFVDSLRVFFSCPWIAVQRWMDPRCTKKSSALGFLGGARARVRF
jgi:hypothetical protein